MECQKSLFDLEDHTVYLNCASMSPMLKRQAEVGTTALRKKMRPYEIPKSDFFEPVQVLKDQFAKLIHCSDADRIALISSVS
ncbi:MAG: aminotransferase, partial [Bacteroidota bacterium]